MKTRPVLEQLEPYVPGKSVAGGIKLSSNENPLGASPRAMEALKRAITDGQAELNRYPDGSIHSLKQRLARFWNVDEEMILVGNGSDEIMVMIAGAFVEPGTNAVTARNTFSQYTFAGTVFGARMRYADMAEGHLDLPAIAGLVDDETRVVFLCNPNNPTATAFTHDQLVQFLGEVPEDLLVVVDEAYGEFADPDTFPRTLELIRTHANIVRLRTFSKIYGLAALRVGYATGQPEVIGAISRLRQPFNVGTLAQLAAEAALDDVDFVQRSIENNRAGRAALCRTLDKLGIAYFPSEANFVCAHLGPTALEVVRDLAAAGVSVRPLSSFGLPEHIRISVGTPSEVDTACKALSALVARGTGTPN